MREADLQGVPEIVAVLLPVFVKRTPGGSFRDSAMAGSGDPVAVMVKLVQEAAGFLCEL
jgi:hypothetical protein